MNILIYGDLTPKSALGNISNDLKHHLSKYNFNVDYSNYSMSIDEILSYDFIIATPEIYFYYDFFNASDHQRKELNSKCVPIFHFDPLTPFHCFLHKFLHGIWTTELGYISHEIGDQIDKFSQKYKKIYLPIGVNTNKFYPTRKISNIKKVGFVGNIDNINNPDEQCWVSNKKPQMFIDIAEKSGLEWVSITNRDHNVHMYDDVDLVICTSISEGNPMGLLESTACKIPFISTPCGIVKEYDKIKTFKTVSDAVDIIKYLNESENNIKEYVNNLYEEMFPNRSWETILENYWIPHINKMINKKVILNNRLDMGKYLTQLGLVGKGVELGVFKGEFAEHTLKNWSGTLYLIDPWRPLCDEEYLDSSNHKNHQTAFSDTMNAIKGFENRAFMLRGLGHELVDLFEDNSLDYIYIDGNHSYDNVKADMEMWYPKLKFGGVFSGHDYLKIDWSSEHCQNVKHTLLSNGKDRLIVPDWGDGEYIAGVFGVNPAVNEFCKKYNKNFSVTDEFWGTWYFIK